MYLKLCGAALVWPACMPRPNIQYVVSFLCTFSASPGAMHYTALLNVNVLGYLHKTKHLGLTYSGRMRVPPSMPERFCKSHGLHAYHYHDSSFGKEVYPWGGYVVFIANAAIAWKASRSKVVPDSTAYAEMAVASKTAHTAVAIRFVLEGLGYGVAGPTPLLGDNQAVRDVIVKNGASAKTRHIERAAMTVNGQVLLPAARRCPAPRRHKADGGRHLTKALDQQTFFSLKDYTLNLDSGPGSRVVLTGQTARLWKKIIINNK